MKPLSVYETKAISGAQVSDVFEALEIPQQCMAPFQAAFIAGHQEVKRLKTLSPVNMDLSEIKTLKSIFNDHKQKMEPLCSENLGLFAFIAGSIASNN